MKSIRMLLPMLAAFAATAASAQPIPRVLAPNTGPGDFVQNVQLHTWPPFLHWDLREFPNCIVPWALGPGAVPDLDGVGGANTAADRAIARAEFAAAFGVWQGVAPSLIGFVEAGAAGAPGGLALDGFNTMNFGDGGLDDVQTVAVGGAVAAGGIVVAPGANGLLESQPQGDDLIVGANIVDGGNLIAESTANSQGSVAGALGLTGLFFNNQSGVIIESDVVFDAAQPWVVNPATNVCAPPAAVQFNLRGVAAHEVGHFIGVAHPAMAAPAGADAADGGTPTMYGFICPAFGGNNFNQTLENADRDPCNFLYTPDLGDAPDPWMGVFNLYPTLVHNPGAGRVLNGLQLDAPALGAEHIFGIKRRQPARNWTYEWLARTSVGDVDAECEADIVDLDAFDDGVTWFPNPPIWGRPLVVTTWIKYASDAQGNAHDYPVRGLYANAWIDLNQNCVWEEWFLSAALFPPPPAGLNTVLTTTATGGVFLPPFVDPTRPVWLRARVDYGEDVGIVANVDGTLAADAGAAQFGEVEDYPFWCRSKYEQQWTQNVLPYPTAGTSLVFVGQPAPSDQYYSAIVDDNDCPTEILPLPIVTYVPSQDETITEYPVPTTVPPGRRKHSGKCKPNPPNDPPLTLVRSHWVTNQVPAQTPPQLVPAELWIPSVNASVGYLLDSEDLEFIVGAVDRGSGGWLALVDHENRVWNDQLNVTVGYRVSPNLIPLANLSPCDPTYAALPLTMVGSGVVNPENAFEFPLSVPGDVPPGHYVILEVESSWSTNGTRNQQIIEFPDPFGNPTPVGETPLPKHLVLESYPNPFNPATTIRFALPKSETVSLAVYDVTGRLVRTLLHNSRKPAGFFEAEWNGTDQSGKQVASGVYFFRLTTSTETLTRKAVLLK